MRLPSFSIATLIVLVAITPPERAAAAVDPRYHLRCDAPDQVPRRGWAGPCRNNHRSSSGTANLPCPNPHTSGRIGSPENIADTEPRAHRPDSTRKGSIHDLVILSDLVRKTSANSFTS